MSGVAVSREATGKADNGRISGTARPRRRRRPVHPGRVIALVLATVWLVIAVAPVYYMVLASLRSQGTYLTANPWLPTGGLSVAEFGTVFRAGLGRYLLNSVLITAGGLIVTLAVSLGAAFRIIRRQSRAAGALFRLLLFGLAIPIQAIIVPLYLLIYKLHSYDTRGYMCSPMSAAALPG